MRFGSKQFSIAMVVLSVHEELRAVLAPVGHRFTTLRYAGSRAWGRWGIYLSPVLWFF